MTTQNHLDIEELIFLNQVAQGVYPVSALSEWFESIPKNRRQLVLKMFAEMIQQARPFEADGTDAIVNSGLKASFTPCVLIGKGVNRIQLAKLCSLPESEQRKTLVLLLSLYRIADQRRRSKEQGQPERHWWHQDLGNVAVLEEIRRQYRMGQL